MRKPQTFVAHQIKNKTHSHLCCSTCFLLVACQTNRDFLRSWWQMREDFPSFRSDKFSTYARHLKTVFAGLHWKAAHMTYWVCHLRASVDLENGEQRSREERANDLTPSLFPSLARVSKRLAWISSKGPRLLTRKMDLISEVEVGSLGFL